MRTSLILLGFVCLFTLPGHAVPLKLNEDNLLEYTSKGAPRLDEISAAFLSVKIRENEVKEGHAPELFGRGSYTETNEIAIIQFQPIFSPVKQAQLGVRKKFTNGLSTTAAIVTDQRSSSSSPFAGQFQNVSTTTLSFTVQLDLWKDAFGRVSKANIESSELYSGIAALEKDIQEKVFKISVRRLYWTLVANQEALNISEELLTTAERQAKEAALRLSNSVAETDEVARYNAQVASRKGGVIYLQFQREALLKQLKNLLPDLANQELVISDYDINKTISLVLACTAGIGGEKKVPYENTKYDEVMASMRKIRSNNTLINSRYSDLDVKLFGTVKSTGVDAEQVGTSQYRGSYGGPVDDMRNHNRSGYEVGMMVSYPLGSAKEETQRTKELYDDKRLMASINSSDAQVINTHDQLVKSISLLTEVGRAQIITSEQLSMRLNFMRKKYQQARVSINDLIMDQDALLNAKLNTIDIQGQILNTLFDYLMVYTETPCQFNRI